ncbi:unnamed protein product [Choristocarpus tenellus]
MVKLESVDMKTNSLTVTGIDLIDGTPVIDVKPVIPYDTPSSLMVPDWVYEDLVLRRVVFSEEASTGVQACLDNLGRKRKINFYNDAQGFKEAVTEVIEYLQVYSIECEVFQRIRQCAAGFLHSRTHFTQSACIQMFLCPLRIALMRYSQHHLSLKIL